MDEYDGELRRRITEFPSWHVFRVDGERHFLAFGENRGELNMISLDTGEILAEVGNGSTTPMIGDWDGNGRLEIFWCKTWYEVSLAE